MAARQVVQDPGVRVVPLRVRRAQGLKPAREVGVGGGPYLGPENDRDHGQDEQPKEGQAQGKLQGMEKMRGGILDLYC